MKAVVFLRIAAVLTFIHSVLHTVGGVFGSVPPGPAAVAAAAMKANQFVFMGTPRTFWDFNRGLGLGITIFLTVESIAFWFLAPLVRIHAEKLRPVLLTFAAGYLAFAVNSYLYFFPGPVIFEIVIALCLVAAAATAREPALIKP